ncbi:endocuticle structural glycoprotein SgAbd-1-like [Macrosteles quadrilineatus]|uniref:endocuticle structural glycoprotein SgAbd-1-like n=1 Tax=Macrosteles quadrilineatus TaxID=74068 RepID=UPI0023E2C2B9|nr:endocuticle structural glycoprotein SgAbd-1-like [Macrosteles quadrilineatus]
MKGLVVFVALAVSAFAAPQVVPLAPAYQSYQPITYKSQYAPAKIAFAAPATYQADAPAYKTYAAPIATVPAYKPVAYSAPAFKPITYSAPAFKPITYSAPAYKPAAYSAPAYKPAAYPAPAYKPVAFSAPAYQYTPQPAYVAQPQYTAASGYVKPVAILRQSQDDNFDGSFSYDFEAENGIASSASGYVKNAGSEDEAQVIQGQYSYTAPDGTPVVTRWFADETGFHAEGAHIPTPGAEPYRTA